MNTAEIVLWEMYKKSIFAYQASIAETVKDEAYELSANYLRAITQERTEFIELLKENGFYNKQTTEPMLDMINQHAIKAASQPKSIVKPNSNKKK